MTRRKSLSTISLIAIFIAIYYLFAQGQVFALSPKFQDGGGNKNGVKIILESPSYDPEQDLYSLLIHINNPEGVSAIQIVVENTELGQTVFESPPISVFNRPLIEYKLSLRGQSPGEYLIKVRAVDHSGKYFEKEQRYGNGNPLDLAVNSIKYAPQQTNKPKFSIISVNPDFEQIPNNSIHINGKVTYSQRD